MNETMICLQLISEVYPRAMGNLSLINHPKGMAGDGVRPLDRMKKALSMKQELPVL